MTEPESSPDHASPREQALHWFTQARLGTLSPAQQQARDAWLAEHARHEVEYRRLEALWQTTERVPRGAWQAMLAQTAPPARHQPRRRRLLLGLGAAGGSALAASLACQPLWLDRPTFTNSYDSERGERRQISLPDGSLLELNTGSRISVSLHRRQRIARLEAGEVLFTVATDADRPFLVEAGHAQIRVTGTQFNVRRDPGQVIIAVTEGSIQVASDDWWQMGRTRLTAGQSVRAASGSGLGQPYAEDVERLISWRRGRLVFADTPLAQVAAELNRYLQRPLRLADPNIGRLRISGTLGIDAPEAALELLPRIAPVAVLTQADGSRLLAAAY